MIRDVDPESGFFSVLGPVSKDKKAQDPGSRIRIRYTASRSSYLDLEISIIVKKIELFLVTHPLLSSGTRI